jgi:hypothetical protein
MRVEATPPMRGVASLLKLPFHGEASLTALESGKPQIFAHGLSCRKSRLFLPFLVSCDKLP